ncbi:MAG: cysteine--tRNA ligase [Chloroflexia bacterium]|nr:cysteine--tRNA ligase [Chloroflexia bacterium]
MSLHVYNSLSRQKELFVPLNEGRVGLYVCGPTVYGESHIGHAKSYVSFDVLVRYLRYLGYRVRYVQNITDVGHLTDDADAGEDKVLQQAARERLEPMELTEKYTRSYFEDMDALRVLRPDISPRASGHIPEQIELVKKLLGRGHAYEVNGAVYFSIETFPEYGQLSGRRVEELLEAVRITPDPNKRHPADFALWKRAEEDHILRWNSPWGWGYPGWHLECSAMSMRYLGDTADIHGGGLENQFPHHESEIAQSEAATGKPFVRYWMHNNMVTVDGIKMGKSLGNFITLKQAFSGEHPLLSQAYSPLTLRFFILSSHYRSPLDFSDQALLAADRGLGRLHDAVRRVRERLPSSEAGPLDPRVEQTLAAQQTRLLEALDDDLNTPIAISVLFDVARESNSRLENGEIKRETLEAYDRFYRQLGDRVLGLIPDELSGEILAGLTESLLEILIDLRAEFRSHKQWEQADALRERLAEAGITLEDGDEGTRWRIER